MSSKPHAFFSHLARRWRQSLSPTLLGALLLSMQPPVAHAFGVVLNDSATRALDVSVLLQPDILINEPPDGTTDRATLFLPEIRRARLFVSGTVHPMVHFLLDVDALAFGFSGRYTPRFFPQDAWLEFDIDPALQIDFGLLQLPFLHSGSEGSFALLGLTAPLGRQLPIYNVNGLTFAGELNGRDLGVMLRGSLLENALNYRVAVTQGVPPGALGTAPANPRALPRVTGRLTWNAFESITGPSAGGFFLPGLTLVEVDGELLSPKRVLSISANASYQNLVILGNNGARSSFGAVGGDLYVDAPLHAGQQSINAQVDYAWYRQGPAIGQEIQTLFAELGYRYHRLEPLVALEYTDILNTDAGDSTYWRGGVNWWIAGHQANLKLDAGAQKIQDATGAGLYQFVARLGGQIWF